ncbi:MAG TPA: NlpC/P60 family protein [Ferruginibacter sp.]|jgi:hypothetical protein|nr:NlpC/P60 family protein [Ferruginibacter sp.]
MKNLFFITFLLAFLLVFSSADAQDSTKKELSASTVKLKNPPKFIDNIELVPQAPPAPQEFASEEIVPAKTIDKNMPDGAAFIENCTTLQFKYAILTDQDVELIKNIALYQFIDNWLGTPYMYGGCTKDGVDCSSFTAQLMQQIFNISIPRTAREQYQACIRIHKQNLKEGDLVFFNTMGRHSISHVGIYLGNHYFVHSSTSSGVMISNLDEDYFSTRFISGGRVD